MASGAIDRCAAYDDDAAVAGYDLERKENATALLVGRSAARRHVDAIIIPRRLDNDIDVVMKL